MLEGLDPDQAVGLQRPQVTIRGPPQSGQSAAPADDLGEPGQVPGPRPEGRSGPARPGGHQARGEVHQGQQGQHGNQPDQGAEAVAGQDGAQTVPLAEAILVEVRSPGGQVGNVAGVGRRGHDHLGAGDTGPPAQVEILAVEALSGVEAAERGEQVGPDELTAAGQVVDVTDGVVLALVVLPRLHVGRRVAGAVDGHPHRQQLAGVVPLGHLGPDQPGIGPARLLDEGRDGAGTERDVVVTDEQVAGPFDGLEGLVGGGTETGVGVDPAHEGRGAGGGHALGRIDGAARVDDEHGEVRVVLGGERAQALVEPRTGFVGHHDRDDGGRDRTGGRRRGIGGGFVHDARRLAVALRPQGAPAARSSHPESAPPPAPAGFACSG